METKILFPGVKDGETFNVAGIEFIKFPEKDGGVPCVAKNLLYSMKFGGNNNFAESEILAKLQKELLPELEQAVGAENIRTCSTDLTALDGLKDYGSVESKISLPTFDFYRENVEIFDRHKIKEWWWLATPDSTKTHNWDVWVVCVAPSGNFNFGNYNFDVGVRPFCIFDSAIFGSREDC